MWMGLKTARFLREKYQGPKSVAISIGYGSYPIGLRGTGH